MVTENTRDGDLKLLCFNLGHLSVPHQFLCCTVLVLLFYLAYGYLQELIFSLEGFRPHGWYLTLIQFALYSIFGSLEQLLTLGKICRRVPWKVYIFLALLTVTTMGCSNASLGYLNYPTQVIFKSCKLVPVMIGSIAILHKRYSTLDFVAAVCMCVGLVFFTLADNKISPNFHVTGVLLLLMALLADAVIGNVQERTMLNFKASNTEVVLFSYFLGFFYIFIGLMLSGELFTGLHFCAQHPQETYGRALAFSVVGYLGIQAVLLMVKICGAVVAVTVTNFRKVVSIIISFILFSKPFTFQYVWSGGLVFLGIILSVYSKNKKPIAELWQQWLHPPTKQLQIV